MAPKYSSRWDLPTDARLEVHTSSQLMKCGEHKPSTLKKKKKKMKHA
jgi:hypothetical protein